MNEPEQFRSDSGPNLILAGASVRSLAESAVRVGWRPACFDLFADADLRRLLVQQGGGCSLTQLDSLRQLPGLLRQMDPQLPLVWGGGLENYPALLRRLSRDRCVCGSSIASILQVRSPERLANIVASSGCEMPEIRSLGSSAPRPTSGGPWLIKPRRGSGGLRVATYSPGRGLARPGMYLQRKVSGIPVSATFVATGTGCRFIGMSIQLAGTEELGASGFWYCGSAGPVIPAPAVRYKIVSAGERIADSGLRGVFGLDLVVDGEQCWLLEVNPRLTSSHELFDLAGGTTPVLGQHLDCFPGVRRRDGSGMDVTSPGPDQAEAPPALARFVIYARRTGRLTQFDVAELLRYTRGAADESVGFRNDPPWGPPIDGPAGATDRNSMSDGHAMPPVGWLADVPMAGPIVAGRPLCTIYRRLPVVPTVDGRSPLDILPGRHAGLPVLNTARLGRKLERLFDLLRNGNNAAPRRKSTDT